MSFQRPPPEKPPNCPWCGEVMVPCTDLVGRLCCPTGESVEYRIGGQRWYFDGRLLHLDEPFPPSPDSGPNEPDEDAGNADRDSDSLSRGVIDDIENILNDLEGNA